MSINAKVFLDTLLNAVELKDGHAINLLADIVECVGMDSFLNFPAEQEGEFRSTLRDMRIRLAGMKVMEALRDEEDFSPQDIEIRLDTLKTLCNGDMGEMAEALAGAR